MNLPKKILGLIQNGVFEPKNPDALTRRMDQLEGKQAVMHLQQYAPYKPVTDKQHAYFHKVICGVLSDHLGYTPIEIKAILKFEFGIRSVAVLSTKQANEFYRQCREWAALKFNCYIPLPGEFDWNEPETPAFLI